ncbi:MAG TPA: SurA N-terminal domain-containing protein [Verrucomicrobiae bacterium]|nr:SurA N-terminal domain-containing protein [Verrucomicrobiae bacterium]
MFGTIRKHQTWLWAVIITITVISFVIFFSPYSKMNGTTRSAGNLGSINGQAISEQDFRQAQAEVALHYFLRTHHWPGEDRRSGFDEEAETYKWLVLVNNQEKMGIHVGEDAAADMARQLMRPFESLGITSPMDFVHRVLERQGLTVADFERFVRHFVGIQEMIGTIGLSGELITPQDAKAFYIRQSQEMATEAVFFNASNYLAGITVLPEQVAQYYSNRVANYAIPERVQVRYVRFDVSNYLAQAQVQLSTNLNSLIEENYQRMGSNYFAGAKTPEESKAKIKEQLLHNQALNDARKKALDFANVLFDLKPVRPENLQELARSNELTVQVTAPFSREEPPKDLDVGADFTKTAFDLTPDDPFAGPLLGEDGVYVIAYDKRLPHEIPPLDQVRPKVVEDYRHERAVQYARQAASSFDQSLTNGLARGQGFTNLCAAASLKPIELPSFSISTRSVPEVEDLIDLDRLKQAAFSTPPGTASNPILTSQGAMVLYVKEKLPIDQEKMQTQLPAYLASLRRTRQEEAFNEWFSREYTKQLRDGLRDTPVGQPQRQPPTLGSAGAKS